MDFPDPNIGGGGGDDGDGGDVTPLKKCSHTQSGKECQRWDSNQPHTPRYRDGKHNNCATPDNDKKPWCYTTDPSMRWEYCDVKKCAEEPEKERDTEALFTFGEKIYSRGVGVTKTGMKPFLGRIIGCLFMVSLGTLNRPNAGKTG